MKCFEDLTAQPRTVLQIATVSHGAESKAEEFRIAGIGGMCFDPIGIEETLSLSRVKVHLQTADIRQGRCAQWFLHPGSTQYFCIHIAVDGFYAYNSFSPHPPVRDENPLPPSQHPYVTAEEEALRQERHA